MKLEFIFIPNFDIIWYPNLKNGYM